MLKDVFHGGISARAYKHNDGRQIIRGPNGDHGQHGNWQLQDAKGVVLDSDQYRFDLAERNKIELVGWAD